MNYERDKSKADVNLRLHGVDFVDAIQAVEDPNRLEEIMTATIMARNA